MRKNTSNGLETETGPALATIASSLHWSLTVKEE